MKVPLVWVKKQPKFEPTTHCHPLPYLLSKSFFMCVAMDLQSTTSKRSKAWEAEAMAWICIFTGISVSCIKAFPSNIFFLTQKRRRFQLGFEVIWPPRLHLYCCFTEREAKCYQYTVTIDYNLYVLRSNRFDWKVHRPFSLMQNPFGMHIRFGIHLLAFGRLFQM